MVNVNTSIAEGSGTLPKEISINSSILVDASSNSAESYEWQILAKPENSTAFFTSPTSPISTFGPLDIVGVYQIKLILDSLGIKPKIKILSFSVPGAVSPIPLPNTPDFIPHYGSIENPRFEVAGDQSGWAADWVVLDTIGVLDSGAGSTRGRIIPTNFTPSGTYCYCLGDDILGSTSTFIDPGEVFEISQEVNFTNANTLKVNLKYIVS